MLVYIITAIMFVLIVINWFLGENLYILPKENGFFNNVTQYNLNKEKDIAADPKYVLLISAVTGILIGLYLAFASIIGIENILITIMALLVFICYLMEITRKIEIREGQVILYDLIFRNRIIESTKIKGMYIYSYNKQFLNKHAYTTKLVITLVDDKRIKFTLSSLDYKAVLNMMKDNFGIVSYKMFLAKKD